MHDVRSARRARFRTRRSRRRPSLTTIGGYGRGDFERGCDDYVCKAIGSSRRARRGAGCWLRATIGVSGRTPMSSSRIAWRRASAARRCLTGRMPGRTRRWGRGSLGHTMTITRRSTVAAGWRSLSPAVAVVGARPGEQRRSGPRRVPATAQIRLYEGGRFVNGVGGGVVRGRGRVGGVERCFMSLSPRRSAGTWRNRSGSSGGACPK